MPVIVQIPNTKTIERFKPAESIQLLQTSRKTGGFWKFQPSESLGMMTLDAARPISDGIYECNLTGVDTGYDAASPTEPAHAHNSVSFNHRHNGRGHAW